MSIVNELARGFVERSNALGYKGKKRDNALLDYFSGACKALHSAGNLTDANHVAVVIAMLFAVRGFAECEKLAKQKDNEA